MQDTLPTHACRASQHLALAAHTHLGRSWVDERVRSLRPARAALWEALRPRGAPRDAPRAQPDGAFYYWLPLPPRFATAQAHRGDAGDAGGDAGDGDERAIAWFAAEHGLLMLPGSAFGRPGFLRLAYGTLANEEDYGPVAERLRRAMEQLARD